MGTFGTSLQDVIVDRLGAFFYWTRFIWQQCTVRQYQFDLSDDLLWKLGLGLGLDLELHYFSIFCGILRRITKTSTLSSANLRKVISC